MHAHHGRVASDLELLAKLIHHEIQTVAPDAAECVGKSEPLMAFAAASIGAFDNVRINCKAVLRKTALQLIRTLSKAPMEAAAKAINGSDLPTHSAASGATV